MTDQLIVGGGDEETGEKTLAVFDTHRKPFPVYSTLWVVELMRGGKGARAK